MRIARSNSSRVLLVPLLAAPLLASAALLDARTQVKAGVTYRTSAELTLETETTAFEFLRDGEPQEGPGMGMMGPSSKNMAFTVVDKILEAKDGQALAVARQYEGLALSNTMVRREEEVEMVAESPFEGVLLELRLDAEGNVAAEVKEGDAPAPERLQGLELGLVLDGLLDGGSAAAGANWELDAAQVCAILLQADETRLFEFPAPEGGEAGGPGGRGGGRRGPGGRGGLFAEAEWVGKAEWTDETESVDGVELAVIKLEIEAQGDLPEMGGFGGPRGGRADQNQTLPNSGLSLDENVYDYELEGRLLYSVAEGRPVRLELSGDCESHTERIMEREEGTMEMRSTRVTHLELTITISAEKAADPQ
jgi:hypothetical protein